MPLPPCSKIGVLSLWSSRPAKERFENEKITAAVCLIWADCGGEWSILGFREKFRLLWVVFSLPEL